MNIMAGFNYVFDELRLRMVLSIRRMTSERVWTTGAVISDRGKWKCSQRYLSQRQFVQQKSHKDCLVWSRFTRGKKSITNRPTYGMVATFKAEDGYIFKPIHKVKVNFSLCTPL
jgi:hypothetical protein